MTPQSDFATMDGNDGPRGGLRRWALIRILAYTVAIVVVVVLSGIVSHKLIPQAPSPLHHNLLIAINLLSAAALIATYAVMVRWLERRRATEVSVAKGAIQFPLGVLAGVALMAAVYLVLWVRGLAVFAPGTGLDGLAGSLAAYTAAAVLEELVFRAVLFRIVEQMTGTMAAIVVSAGLFGLLHGLNPGVTAMGIAGVILAAGVTFALLFALTRNLWLVIGVHLGWNFAEGGLFGAQVSGSAGVHSLFRTTLAGPDLLTGGSFGPEGSVVTIALYLLVAAVLAVWVVRRGEWHPWRFRLAPD